MRFIPSSSSSTTAEGSTGGRRGAGGGRGIGATQLMRLLVGLWIVGCIGVELVHCIDCESLGIGVSEVRMKREVEGLQWWCLVLMLMLMYC